MMIVSRGGDKFIQQQTELRNEKMKKRAEEGKPAIIPQFQGLKVCNDDALKIQRGVSIFKFCPGV